MADGRFDHTRAVLDAMVRAGCAPSDPGVIVFDGVRHRFHVDGDRKGRRNGWFILYADGIPAGAFGSWKTGCSTNWCAEADPAWTVAERRAWQRPFAAVRAQRAADEQMRHEQACARARQLWARARPRVDAEHPYLVKKRVAAVGLRQLGSLLVIPVQDLDGALHSLAFISAEGEKRYLKEGAVEGHCHVLGTLHNAKTILLCEGYATGASLYRASGGPVVVCFHAGNLRSVAIRLRQRHLTAALVIAGDDDRYTPPHNPGRTRAQQAAEAVNGSVLLPDFTGLDPRHRPTDFNDVQVLGGEVALQAQIQQALTAAPARSPIGSSESPGGGGQHPIGVSEVIEMAAANRRRTGKEGHRGDRAGRSGGASRNLYQEVTDRIITMIENGAAPWQRPWDRPRPPHVPALPLNAVTGQSYQGINILLLQAHLLSFDDPRWCGYEQAKTRGWQVKAGARGTTIYFFKRLEISDANDSAEEPPLDEEGRPLRKTIPLLRQHWVYHASQIEGIPTLEEAYGAPTTGWVDHAWDREAHLEAVLHRSGARILHEGTLALYRPAEDRIYLPPPARFPSSGHYYGVAYHELGHWTGHPDRLNRPFCFNRGAPEYAREELRAELASAFLGAELGIQYDLESHAAYLDHYLDLLRRDNREIFRAARDAQAIADLVLDRHPNWQLRQGVCVPRTDPLPGEEPTPDPADDRRPDTTVIPATDRTTVPENPAPAAAGTSGDHSPALSTPMTPYRWAALALCSLETTEEEGGALGRLSRWIDAVVPWRPPPISPGTEFPKRAVLPPPPPPPLAPTRQENPRCRPVAPC